MGYKSSSKSSGSGGFPLADLLKIAGGGAAAYMGLKSLGVFGGTDPAKQNRSLFNNTMTAPNPDAPFLATLGLNPGVKTAATFAQKDADPGVFGELPPVSTMQSMLPRVATRPTQSQLNDLIQRLNPDDPEYPTYMTQISSLLK